MPRAKNPARKRQRKYECTPEGRRANAIRQSRRRARLREVVTMIDEAPTPRESPQC